jgi:hypothetical protein
MFCCKSFKKAKDNIEAYQKVKAEDKKQFLLKAKAG